jgi:hypothetical protein
LLTVNWILRIFWIPNIIFIFYCFNWSNIYIHKNFSVNILWKICLALRPKWGSYFVKVFLLISILLIIILLILFKIILIIILISSDNRQTEKNSFYKLLFFSWWQTNNAFKNFTWKCKMFALSGFIYITEKTDWRKFNSRFLKAVYSLVFFYYDFFAMSAVVSRSVAGSR